MKQHRLNLYDIPLGEPLAWDVYGEGQKLLLRQGYIVENAEQIASLLERGLYIEAHHLNRSAEVRRKTANPDERKEVPSVVRMLDAASRNLESVLTASPLAPNLAAHVGAIAASVSTAVGLNAEIALACVNLDQIAGPYPIRHGIATAVMTCVVARAMRKDANEMGNIMAAALTMNLGMLEQHEHLHHNPAPLTKEERKLIHDHPVSSVALLTSAGIDNADWLSCVLLHHENENGSGYPLGPAVGALPQNAKILALADRYCACVAERDYRKSLTPPAAMRNVFAGPGKGVDTLLAAYFIKVLGSYPPGTFVRLQNGEIAVVTGKGTSLTHPSVRALIAANGDPLSAPIKRDTTISPFGIAEPLRFGEAQLRFSMRQFWGDAASL